MPGLEWRQGRPWHAWRRGVIATATIASTVGAGLAVVVPVPSAAAADARPDLEVPFGCGQRWQATTRPDHSPSSYAVDFGRAGDHRAPVVNSAPGVVTDVVDLGAASYGKYVVVRHGRGWSTLSAHLAAQWVVEGQWLDQGRVIGLVGSTGNSSGSHLHHEQRHDGSLRRAVFHDRRLDYNSTIRSRSCGDVPVTGDWDGNGRTEVAVFHPRRTGSVFRLRRHDGRVSRVRLGSPLDRPVTGDWDGDGRTDVGVWKPRQQEFRLRKAGGRRSTVGFGRPGGAPLAGDWDGDGRTDLGAFVARRRTFLLRSSNGSVRRVKFGAVGSVPAVGDWDGDGRDDLGTYQPRTATWRLRVGRTGAVRTVTFGGARRLPVPGDWDGDGDASLGTWNPARAVFTQQRASGPVRIAFGARRG